MTLPRKKYHYFYFGKRRQCNRCISLRNIYAVENDGGKKAFLLPHSLRQVTSAFRQACVHSGFRWVCGRSIGLDSHFHSPHPIAAIQMCLMGVPSFGCVLVNYVLSFCVHGLFIYINGVGLWISFCFFPFFPLSTAFRRPLHGCASSSL